MFKKSKDYDSVIDILNEKLHILLARVTTIEDKIKKLEETVKVQGEDLEDVTLDVDKVMGKIALLETDFSELRKYYLEQYISSVDRLFDFVKTISVITSVSSKDAVGLKRELMSPIVNVRNQQVENQRAEGIGHKILAKKKNLEDERLVLEREGKNTEKVDAKIKELSILLEEK